MLELRDMFTKMVEMGASDLHLVVGAPPQLRVRGDLVTIGEFEELTPEDTREIVFGILTNEQRQKLEVQWELDFSYSVPGMARWRVNAFYQRGAVGAAFRIIPEKIRPLSELAVPDSVYDLAKLARGLVLVTGPTGSGKSTTLAGIIDIINEQRNDHILTVEDPIEFIHQHKNCIINQREVGSDTDGFAKALKSALRQDPDVILVGEMRDLETIQTALTAAETGHLVFGTLHTSSAAKTVDRIIDVFPPHQQEQVRVQLAASLQGVVAQALVPTADGAGRVAACEVMLPNNAIRNLIREGKVFQIPSVMQTSQGEGMQTLDAALATLVRSNTVTQDEAIKYCHEPDEFTRLMSNGGGAPATGRVPYMRPDKLRLRRVEVIAPVEVPLDVAPAYGLSVGDPTQAWAPPAAAVAPDPGQGWAAAPAQPAPPAPLVPGQMPDLPGAPGGYAAPPAPYAEPAAQQHYVDPAAQQYVDPAQHQYVDPAAQAAWAVPAPPAPAHAPQQVDPATGLPWQAPGEVA